VAGGSRFINTNLAIIDLTHHAAAATCRIVSALGTILRKKRRRLCQRARPARSAHRIPAVEW
jgi:hypothetical protein